MGESVLVIGDTIIDHDIFCDSIGLSLETPTLKTRFKNERYLHGGAANVVEHLLALEYPVIFITAVGSDKYSETVLGLGEHKNLDLRPLSYEGQNLVKSRYWVARGTGNYKYLQINQGSKSNSDQLITNLIKALHKPDTVIKKAILVDYANGLFESDAITQKVISILKSHNVRVYSSRQKSDRQVTYYSFKGSDVICMNKYEADSAMRSLETDSPQQLGKVLNSSLCVTDGPNGCRYYTIFPLLEPEVHYDAVPVQCVDPCGAGDAFLAALVATEDCDFANKWAALSVTKLGTEVPKLEDLNEL